MPQTKIDLLFCGININEDIKARPPLRYPGSKYRAAKHITPFLNKINYDEYREPMLGSGAIFFVQPLVKYIWLNDIDEDLILTFQFIADQRNRDWLKEEVSKVNPTKEYFYELKEKQPRSISERAFRYFVINRTAYSGIMNKANWGFHPQKSVQPFKWASLIEYAGKKLEKASKITCVDYKRVISAPQKGYEVLLFIDPPYFKTDQKRAYSHSFTQKDHFELLSLLKVTPFKFCLTYDNCDEIKRLYSWANVHEVEWRYHTANSNETTRKMGQELIITNY